MEREDLDCFDSLVSQFHKDYLWMLGGLEIKKKPMNMPLSCYMWLMLFGSYSKSSALLATYITNSVQWISLVELLAYSICIDHERN